MSVIRSQIESGAELLARLNAKPSLHRLEDTLLAGGPRNTDVIEIDGEAGTGKTLLLSKMLANCILPHHCQTNGCNASAILINTDHHFQVSKLIEIMTVESNQAALFPNSLHKLRIINCYNSEQLFLTLHTLDDLFLTNSEIALLAIDSITAFYWQDREDRVATTMESYAKKLLKTVKVHTARFNVATVYTRTSEYIGEKKRKKEPSADDVDYKIRLARTREPDKFLCTFKSMSEPIRESRYSIYSHGIKWEANEKEG